MNLLPRKSLRGYLEQYGNEHTQLGTKLTHVVGIPLIAASIPTAVVNPPLGAGMFTVGWALQFIGHAVFEKKKPSFFADPYYLLVGPVWVAIEVGQFVRIVPKPVFKDEAAPPSAHAQNGAAREAGAAQPSA